MKMPINVNSAKPETRFAVIKSIIRVSKDDGRGCLYAFLPRQRRSQLLTPEGAGLAWHPVDKNCGHRGLTRRTDLRTPNDGWYGWTVVLDKIGRFRPFRLDKIRILVNGQNRLKASSLYPDVSWVDGWVQSAERPQSAEKNRCRPLG